MHMPECSSVRGKTCWIGLLAFASIAMWLAGGCDQSDNIDQLPSLSITSPADQSTVGGTVEITAVASDDIGIDHVDFYVDDYVIPGGTDVTPPYTCSWNSMAFPEEDFTDTTYVIRVKAYDVRGNSTTQQVQVKVRRITETDQAGTFVGSVDPGDWCPSSLDYGFDPAYPNPTSGEVDLEVYLPTDARVIITILDARDEAVKLLLDQNLGAGRYIIHWDGKDSEGASLPAGVYRAVMTAGGHSCFGDILIEI